MITAFSHFLAHRVTAHDTLYQVWDTAPLPVRTAKRRGRGWFAGQANSGWSLRLGWYGGFHWLTAATPQGVITGWAFAAASAKEQPLAETFFAWRADPQPGY